ncbi:hypothetical protein PV419_46790 [Streptomyces sp. ME19-01-6]|nr:hypothetical protein [Streptomyces sp. ME19-01-6]
MTVTTSRYIGPAAPSPGIGHSPHPLANREIRTALNYALRPNGGTS